MNTHSRMHEPLCVRLHTSRYLKHCCVVFTALWQPSPSSSLTPKNSLVTLGALHSLVCYCTTSFANRANIKHFFPHRSPHLKLLTYVNTLLKACEHLNTRALVQMEKVLGAIFTVIPTLTNTHTDRLVVETHIYLLCFLILYCLSATDYVCPSYAFFF